MLFFILDSITWNKEQEIEFIGLMNLLNLGWTVDFLILIQPISFNLMGKPYMPLMMGDWIKGTRGMRAEVKGVYIGLLIHQYDTGFIPNDLEELSLIEPEVGKVWVKLKDKFKDVGDGKLQNEKCEEVRAFWSKQSVNGKKGGRPKTQIEPKYKPKGEAKSNLHIDLDNDLDINIKEDSSFLIPKMLENWMLANPSYPKHKEKDFKALGEISRFIHSYTKCNESLHTLTEWGLLTDFILADGFLKSYSLDQVNRHLQNIIQSKKNGRTNNNTKQGFGKSAGAIRLAEMARQRFEQFAGTGNTFG